MRVAFYFLLLLLSYLLQYGLDFFEIGGVRPDVLLISALVVALLKGEFTGVWIGFFAGLIEDIHIGVVEGYFFLGLHVLAKSLLAYLAGKFRRHLHLGSFWMGLPIIFLGGLLEGGILSLLGGIFFPERGLPSLWRVIIPDVIYTSVFYVFWGYFLFWALPQEELR